MAAEKRTKLPTESKSYLDRLTFDPKLKDSLVGRFIQNIRLVILLIITIALLGTVAYTQLPKRLNPEVEIPIVTVVTVLPGAGPTDVESLITIPIEDALRSLKDIDTITSNSRDNVSIVTLQFLSTVSRDKARDDVQSKVDSVRDLPEDAQDPSVTALDFEDQPIWQFALVTEKSFPDLMNTVHDLRDHIEDVGSIDRVSTSGFDVQEVIVEVDSNKLAQYGLNPFQLSQQLKRARASLPAGTVETGANTFALTIDPEIETVDDIRSLQITVQGKTLALSDIASVALRSKPGQALSYVATPDQEARQGVTFSIFKTVGTDIDAAGEDVKVAVEEFMAENGEGYEIITLSNASEEIVEQFTHLVGEFRTTILLVMGTLLLFLGLRQALISSLTVPLTFLSAFFLMQVFGMSINFLSLFAFLLALGLLVDDTIVVVSAMTTYYRSGRFTPLETGILVWKDTIVPIWSTTLTTIWSFVPLLITSGIIGEFIKPIPIVVTVTMISSTAIAVLITLPLMIVLLKPVIPSRLATFFKIVLFVSVLAVVGFLTFKSPIFPIALFVYVISTLVLLRVFPAFKNRTQAVIQQALARRSSSRAKRTGSFLNRLINNGVIDVEAFADRYRRFIARILKSKSARRNVLIAVVGYSIFSFSLLPLGFVKNEFFPKTDVEQLFVQLELPAGTTQERTQAEAMNVLNQLRNTTELHYVTADVGRGAGDGFGGGGDGSNLATFTLRLSDLEERSIASYDIAEELRKEFENYPNGTVSIIEQSGGPPAGADIQIGLLGEDLSELNHQADRVVEFLSQQEGLTNVNKSVKEGTSKVVFIPDTTKLTENGISADTLGFALRLYASGFTLDELKLSENADQETEVVLRLHDGSADIEGLSQLSVTNPQGQSVPLMSLGRLETEVNPTSITREDFQRSLTVTAAVRPGSSISEENTKLQEFTQSIELPNGYEWKTGGVNDENAKSIQSILQAMVLSAVLIMITMVVQFGSFRQAAIVLIVIPLAVSSVFLAFALTGTALSFPAMIGVLSLFGIVVTNSMFIVDKINLNQKEGMNFEDSIADAGASRLEPIILTKVCTIFGLLPITIADPLWRGLGGAIISGLLVSSTIMLLFIPVLYYTWMKPEK